MSTFDSTNIQLPKIIEQITEGKVQLPDFQRGWIWDDDHVRSLLVSMGRSFPVGAIMLLETGGDVKFQVRPIENVPFKGTPPPPEKLILDGQQRLTSLTQVLALDKPVRTYNDKRQPVERYYYINIKEAMEEDLLDDAIFAVDTNKKIMTNFGRDVKLDLSTRKLECQQLMFPCSEILNSDSWEESLQEFAAEEFSYFMKFRKNILNNFRSYQLPVIALGKATSKEAVCVVFEKVNTGGVPLTVFELITASFASDGFNLRDDWLGSKINSIDGRKKRIKEEQLLEPVEDTDFIQAITLLQTYKKRKEDEQSGKTGKRATAVSGKRSAMLALKLEDYCTWANMVEEGFGLAASFLKKQSFYSSNNLPYRTQLIPLAVLLALLKDKWLEPRIYEKLCRWYWCGALGELYGGAVDTRIANDLEEFMHWIDNDEEEPKTVKEGIFHKSRLLTLRSRNSAAYKALNILVLRQGSVDFFWKAKIQELEADGISLDFHHIFPRKWCKDQEIKQAKYDSIINKTPISSKTNRMIGGNAPSEYLQKIQKHPQVKLDDSEMDKILETHMIDPDKLRNNDFNEFVEARTEALLGLVKSVGVKVSDSELDTVLG